MIETELSRCVAAFMPGATGARARVRTAGGEVEMAGSVRAAGTVGAGTSSTGRRQSGAAGTTDYGQRAHGDVTRARRSKEQSGGGS